VDTASGQSVKKRWDSPCWSCFAFSASEVTTVWRYRNSIIIIICLEVCIALYRTPFQL